MADFSDRIYELLKESDLSYQGFADKVNALAEEGAKLTKSFIADIVNGKNGKIREPGYKTIVKIAKAFDVTTDWLLGISDIRGAANDDVNIASKTTGLSVACIESLNILKDDRLGTEIIKTLEKIIADYFKYETLSEQESNYFRRGDVDVNIMELMHEKAYTPRPILVLLFYFFTDLNKIETNSCFHNYIIDSDDIEEGETINDWMKEIQISASDLARLEINKIVDSLNTYISASEISAIEINELTEP